MRPEVIINNYKIIYISSKPIKLYKTSMEDQIAPTFCRLFIHFLLRGDRIEDIVEHVLLLSVAVLSKYVVGIVTRVQQHDHGLIESSVCSD